MPEAACADSVQVQFVSVVDVSLSAWGAAAAEDSAAAAEDFAAALSNAAVSATGVDVAMGDALVVIESYSE